MEHIRTTYLYFVVLTCEKGGTQSQGQVKTLTKVIRAIRVQLIHIASAVISASVPQPMRIASPLTRGR